MPLVYNDVTGNFEERMVDPDVEFLKTQFQRIDKNPFYKYIAITNNLIGTATCAKTIKPIWLSSPMNYIFKPANYKEPHRYSTNGGITFVALPYDSSRDNLDYAANYTCKLFRSMGVMEDFRDNGVKAIDYIIKHELLKYH